MVYLCARRDCDSGLWIIGESRLRMDSRGCTGSESRIQSQGHVSGALAACITKYVEPRMSPKEVKSEEGSKGGKEGNQAAQTCIKQAEAISSGHTGEWSTANTQELENLLQASFVTDVSCYVKYVENRIPPVGTEALKPWPKRRARKPNPSARPAKKRKKKRAWTKNTNWSTPIPAAASRNRGKGSIEEG